MSMGGSDGVGLVGAPSSGVGGLANKGVGNRDVGNNVMNVAAPVELDISAAAGVEGIRGGKGAR